MFLIVFLTALGVGGTTMLGAVGGYCFRGAAKRAGDGAVLSFAAGIMLSAAVAGLILPRRDLGRSHHLCGHSVRRGVSAAAGTAGRPDAAALRP